MSYEILHRATAADVADDQPLIDAVIPAGDLEDGDTLIANIAAQVSNDSENATVTLDVYFGEGTVALTVGDGIADGLDEEKVLLTLKVMRVGSDLWVFDPSIVAGYGTEEQLGKATAALPNGGNVQVIADADFTIANHFKVKANISGVDVDDTCIMAVQSAKVFKQ